jgi:hypothetical protein
MEVFIARTVYNKFKYLHYVEETQNILEIINRDCRLSKGLMTHSKSKLYFKSQVGGKKQMIKLKDGKTYEYHIDTIVPYDDTKKQISFLNLTETNDNCMFLFFDTQNSKENTPGFGSACTYDNPAVSGGTERRMIPLYIQSISNQDDCIKSEDNRYKYKVGDILMQIIIQLVKEKKLFSHIKQIELTDISKKMCYGIGLQLIYLRTITHGIPYYAKYGFRPNNEEDYDIFKYNRNNFKLNKTITNDKLLQIIEKSKSNDNNSYKKYFYDYIKSNNIINPKILLTDMIKVMNNTNDVNEKKEICNFIHKIYKKIFNILGYKDYENKIWILEIR